MLPKLTFMFEEHDYEVGELDALGLELYLAAEKESETRYDNAPCFGPWEAHRIWERYVLETFIIPKVRSRGVKWTYWVEGAENDE